jgi:hypothetical protein
MISKFEDNKDTKLHPILKKWLEVEDDNSEQLQDEFIVGQSIKTLNNIKSLFVALHKELSPIDVFSIKYQLLIMSFMIGDKGFGGFSEELGVINEISDLFGFNTIRNIEGSYMVSGMEKDDKELSFDAYINMTVSKSYINSLIKSI